MVLVVAVPFVMSLVTRAPEEQVTSTGPKLIIISPHNEQIRGELEKAFNRYRVELGEEPVLFDWRAGGGTSDLRRQILAQFSAAGKRGEEDQGIGADLFFGGGEYEHNQLAKGVKVMRDGEEIRITASVPVNLPEGLLVEALPEQRLGGERLYHDELYWVGTALSSFGIVYNRDVLSMLDVPTPRTWADMADPKLQGWVALADPNHSGSIAATYLNILRREGWTEGWSTLRRVFANSRYFAESSSKVPVDVSMGEAVMGMCIDFYGRYQAGAIGGDRVGYVDPVLLNADGEMYMIDGHPVSMTAITADPISLLRGARQKGVAEQFIAWTLTKEAQQLWQRKQGVEDGPLQYELRRQPIRVDMYTPEEIAYWTDQEIRPFDIAQPFPKAMPSFYSAVAPIVHAMAIDIHHELVAAWKAINDTDPSHPNYDKMLELFDAMPEELTLVWPDDELAQQWSVIIEDPNHPRYDEVAKTLKDFFDGWGKRYPRGSDALLKDRVKWTQWFRDNYREVVRLSKQ